MIARIARFLVFGCFFLGSPAVAGPRGDADAPLPGDLAAEVQRSIDRGLSYLRSSQKSDGGWGSEFGPAVAAIAGQAFAQDRDHGPTNPVVRRAVTYIRQFEQTDGGIYERKQNLANYQTSVVLLFLASLKDTSQQTRVAKAQDFLTKLQYDEAESVDKANPWYGGAGYNSSKRPDLSNTQMMLEALHQSGLSPNDPVYQRALVFVSRCQMNAATNDQSFAKLAGDGGFIYSPNGQGESKASASIFESRGALRSYGSMTYAGFKSLLYCNCSHDDDRIKACLNWIKLHYDLDKNPNMPGKQAIEGLYYYYHVMARALTVWGEPVVIDTRGGPHNWRIDLARKILSLQRPDGSWVNERDRWLEGDPNYVTGLTVQTLQVVLR